MDEKSFVWTSELNQRFFELRFENDWLFKKKKQPWGEFHKILMDNGFPEEMTISQVRKKWSYIYDMYKLAKKTKNKSWKYYKLFDKHFGKTKVLDKYESWTDDWRLKLITSITETKSMTLDVLSMWKTVERSLRSQDLPLDCCIQDIKGLWQHIRTTFNRKHRLKIKKGAELSEWPLYDVMLSYFQTYEPEYVVNLENEAACGFVVRRRIKNKFSKKQKNTDSNDNENEFQWSKDITETFIQIRLQNDWLFSKKKWAWNDLHAIMVGEYGFPKTLTSREICRKWAATFSEYQKAKATNNKSWMYYNLFEVYLGEGRLSLNPIIDWQEEWVHNFISARVDSEHGFSGTLKDQLTAWREVEKRLRSVGLPLDHSLLDLPEIWTHLLKTFRWKKKFANKGILNEQWPYYEAMAQYVENKVRVPVKKKPRVVSHEHYDDLPDDYEDDMKLFDLKQRLQVKPKYEETHSCRSCWNEEACVDIFAQPDGDGLDIASKLRTIGGVEVDQSDHLPSQICLNCLRELEDAFKFRLRCQDVDKHLRSNNAADKIKVEIDKTEENDENEDLNNIDDLKDGDHHDIDDNDNHFEDAPPVEDMTSDVKPTVKTETPKVIRKRKKQRKLRYDYWKICEVCGKPTRNLISHLDMHSNSKPYSCDVCDKKFKFKSGLVIHKAVHDPTPRKTCEVCGKTFHIVAQYRRHFVYHANERKYECETCGKRFNTLDILRVHNRTHTDERPFSCQVCGKSFRTAGCVSRHKRIVHNRNLKLQRLWWVAAALLVWTPHAYCRNVTHEDIRDAMMSLVHMFRTSESKLERHEYREKTSGEQLKKLVLGLEKKHRALEPLKGMISRLDERLSNVETILLQKEEREKTTQQKTADALNDIQKSLLALTASLNKKPAASADIENNLTTNDDTLETRLASTDAKIDAVKSEIENLKNSLSKDNLRAMCLDVASDVNPLEKHISEAEKLLNKYELKLNEYGNSSKVPTDFVPLSEVSLADEAWHSKMSEVMEKQEKEIVKIQKLLSDAESMWKDLPRLADLQISINQTLEAIESAKEDLKETSEKVVSQVAVKLREMTDRLATTNEDIQNSLTQGNTMTEHAYNDISRSYESLKNEVQSLTKNERVLIETADNVIATKKRIEYGVHQILAEVGELVRNQGNSLNKTVNDRFDNVQLAILEKQSTAQSNISDKIETEMAPVWRQIGSMYKQLTANKESLDKLTEQTGRYVNDSSTSMDNINDKVGKITARMTEVDDNLNYLLGRLSLVTQEFHQIKTGLGEALDKAKSNLRTVQDKEDKGPGPHNISSAEKTD
ncbi:uncharacterized protein LOC114352370 [Ostrinia furnacalis]|uniref:uncharacterized protein LOC114352370 n=1 Tax=Ostrinia furnacalis TaxID=93504 RepID=UPI00103A9BAA|nr:uncharacterized protein LOC114352370 [Ostrinia furnacalis]